MSIIEREVTEPKVIKIEQEPPIRAKILRRAASILEEVGWVRGDFALDEKGYRIDPDDVKKFCCQAVGYCGWGAIYRAEIELTEWQGTTKSIFDTTDSEAERFFSADWNDNIADNAKQVIELLNQRATEVELGLLE